MAKRSLPALTPIPPGVHRLSDDTAWQRDHATYARYDSTLSLPSLDSWLDGLHVSFVSAVDWHCTPDWVLGPRIVADSMFFSFHSGHGEGAVEDERFEIRGGDIMLIPQGASHWVRQDAGTEMHISAVHFHAHVFGGINLLELLGFPVLIRPQLPRDAALIDIPHQLDRDDALKPAGHKQASAALITQFLLHLIRHLGPQFKPPYKTERINDLRRLLPAFDHVERNLADGGISIGDMAKKVFISEVQFRKLFRRVTGLSPVRYIQSRRVQRASRLLRESDLSLEQIAQEVGFSDAPFFCRVFKIWTKATPIQYRQGKGGQV